MKTNLSHTRRATQLKRISRLFWSCTTAADARALLLHLSRRTGCATTSGCGTYLKLTTTALTDHHRSRRDGGRLPVNARCALGEAHGDLRPGSQAGSEPAGRAAAHSARPGCARTTLEGEAGGRSATRDQL